jgi:hypothetical protein
MSIGSGLSPIVRAETAPREMTAQARKAIAVSASRAVSGSFGQIGASVPEYRPQLETRPSPTQRQDELSFFLQLM